MKVHTNPWGEVHVGRGSVEVLGAAWRAAGAPGRIFFLVDENTHDLCLPRVMPEVPDGWSVEVLEVPAGEESKEAAMAVSLWEALQEHNAHRNDWLVSVGGGMVTDLGGFVAATYKRGMRYAALPTSLLAMVDASAGGKSGVNLPGLKNAVGTFYRAECVLVDPVFLDTLPARQWAAGWAEMIKHAYLEGGSHWAKISSFPDASAEEQDLLIDLSIAFKASVVAQDPEDRTGHRAALNAGHTVGHALEAGAREETASVEPGNASSEPAVLHGEAVAAGLWMESWISDKMGMETDGNALRALIRSYFVGSPLSSFDRAWSAMLQDKKNTGDSVRMALIQRAGAPVRLTEVPRYLVEEAWQAYGDEFFSK